MKIKYHPFSGFLLFRDKVSSVTPRWVEAYAEWRYWNPELTADEQTAALRSCRGKLAYPDFLTALGAVEALNRDVTDGDTLNLYRCELCKQTHIGNMQTSPAILVDQQWSHFLMAPVRERDKCNAR